MALITTATDRMKKGSHVSALINGPIGIGKTTLVATLPAKTTLFIDFEAGTKAVEDWEGDIVDVRDIAQKSNKSQWEIARYIASVLAGPDPSRSNLQTYGKAHYDEAVAFLGGTEQFDKYEDIFVDSITVAGRQSFSWSSQQPAAFNKEGKPNPLGAYGLHGQEMIEWLTTMHHIKGKNKWVVGILDEKTDDYNQKYYALQIDGSKSDLALPGIFDQVITMAGLKTESGDFYRALITKKENQWGYPAKDRSGRLAPQEEPDLSKIIAKINTPKRTDVHTTELPTTDKEENNE